MKAEMVRFRVKIISFFLVISVPYMFYNMRYRYIQSSKLKAEHQSNQRLESTAEPTLLPLKRILVLSSSPNHKVRMIGDFLRSLWIDNSAYFIQPLAHLNFGTHPKLRHRETDLVYDLLDCTLENLSDIFVKDSWKKSVVRLPGWNDILEHARIAHIQVNKLIRKGQRGCRKTWTRILTLSNLPVNKILEDDRHAKVRIVYVYSNPKDILQSLYDQRDPEHKSWIDNPEQICESMDKDLSVLKGFKQDRNVLVTSFNSKNSIEKMKEILDFTGGVANQDQLLAFSVDSHDSQRAYLTKVPLHKFKLMESSPACQRIFALFKQN